MEYYLAMKRNKLFMQAKIWMNLKGIEVSFLKSNIKML